MIPFARRPLIMRRFAAALFAVAVLGLPACGDDNKGTVLPTRSATPSPTSSEPVLPEAAKQHTREGADAFARHFMAVLNYAVATGDVRQLKALSGPTCKSCANFVKTIDGVYPEGKLVGGQATIIEPTKTPPLMEGVIPATHIDFVRSTQQHVLDGKILETVPEVRSKWIVSLKWADHGWHVFTVKRGKPSP